MNEQFIIIGYQPDLSYISLIVEKPNSNNIDKVHAVVQLHKDFSGKELEELHWSEKQAKVMFAKWGFMELDHPVEFNKDEALTLLLMIWRKYQTSLNDTNLAAFLNEGSSISTNKIADELSNLCARILLESSPTTET